MLIVLMVVIVIEIVQVIVIILMVVVLASITSGKINTFVRPICQSLLYFTSILPSSMPHISLPSLLLLTLSGKSWKYLQIYVIIRRVVNEA